MKGSPPGADPGFSTVTVYEYKRNLNQNTGQQHKKINFTRKDTSECSERNSERWDQGNNNQQLRQRETHL
jgi:hypothetical protein